MLFLTTSTLRTKETIKEIHEEDDLEHEMNQMLSDQTHEHHDLPELPDYISETLNIITQVSRAVARILQLPL